MTDKVDAHLYISSHLLVLSSLQMTDVSHTRKSHEEYHWEKAIDSIP